MKNKLIQGIVLLAILACTILVYYLLFDEHTKLFYINVVVACVSEVILLTNLSLFANEKWLTFKNAATSTILNLYAIVLFLWTSIDSLYVTEEKDFKILYIGILITSICFIALLGLTEIGGRFMQKQEQDFQQVTYDKQVFRFSMNQYWLEVQACAQGISVEWKETAIQKLRMVLDKITIIPSQKLATNASIMEEIKLKLEEIKKMFAEAAVNTDDSNWQNKINQQIEQLKNYIGTIKSLL